MKTNLELRGTLNAVLARLGADKHDAEEWECIAAALADAHAYAAKMVRLKKQAAHPAHKGSVRA